MEGFTNKYNVERLVYWASFDDVHLALAREKQLKGWSRAKKISDRGEEPALVGPGQGVVPVDGERWCG
jgi:predicted GIY-YIG superfamily endonuclease